MASIIRERMPAHSHDLGGGFSVRRLLPSKQQHAVGPFVFMDHFGPVTLPADRPMDVRPHPHIGLATVTYLWEGRIEHRDGLGNNQLIESGAVNWMTAGRGIVHSERTSEADRGREQRLHGLQLWVALPLEHERTEAAFEHTEAAALPSLMLGEVSVRVVAGEAYGVRSPVSIIGELFYVDARVPRGERLALPEEHVQRAAYVIEGQLQAGGETLEAGELTVFEPGATVALRATADTHVVLLGGAPLEAPRYLWWNYVASSEALLDEARQAWEAQRYPMVVGDPEFIPLPTEARATLLLKSG